MYNLNVNVNVNASPASAAGLLSVAAAGEVTPRTPEIVNSLIAMTNPFDGYTPNNAALSCERSRDRNDSTSSGGEPSPPSIQTTCSHLIKESLKLTLQTKRRVNGCTDDGKKRTRREDGSGADDEEEDESSNSKCNNGKLTPEDEERRRRRRERNKIAATKCRMKKREKTTILVQESETLETQNHELKSQIQELETQQRRLVDMLQLHRPTCIKQQPQPHQQDANYQQQQQPQQYAEPVSQLLPSYQENFAQQQLNTQSSLPDCSAIVSDYGAVKVEGFEAVAQDFFGQQQQQQQQQQQHQQNPYNTSTAATTNAGSDATGCTV